MSCTHVTCHVRMSHVMYLCHIPTVRSFTCNDNHILTNFRDKVKHKLCDVTCHVISHVMCYVTCHVSYHVSWQKSCNVKYLATHILLLNNYFTKTNYSVKCNVSMSQVMYPCHKSSTHVTCHVSMSHVMYPFHMSCIHVTCHVFMYPCHMSGIHITFQQ